MSRALFVNTGTRGKGTAEKVKKEAGEKTQCRISNPLVTSNLGSP